MWVIIIRPLLGAVLLEGTACAALFPPSEVILVVVIDEGLLWLAVTIAVGATPPVLIVQNYVGVSIDALHTDAEAIGASSIRGSPGGAGRLGVGLR